MSIYLPCFSSYTDKLLEASAQVVGVPLGLAPITSRLLFFLFLGGIDH